MILLILLVGRMPEEDVSTAPQLSTNADRVAYLEDLGWELETEPVETLQFLLPDVLDGSYLSYNSLQLSQGFDLSECCGKQVSRYTYTVLNYPGIPAGVQCNLYICENQPVAGDILCPGANGFQTSLLYPDSKPE